MFSGIINTLRGITVGSPRDDSSEEEEEDDIQVPQVRTGITTSGVNGTQVPRQSQSQQPVPSSSNEVPKKQEEVQTCSGSGLITAYDPCLQKGIINRQFSFDIEKFCRGNQDYRKGSRVEFEAERSRSSHWQWSVTHMKLEETEIQKINKERNKYRTVLAIVKSIGEDYVEVEKREQNRSQVIRVPNTPQLAVGFDWMPGDYMKLELENLLPDDDDFPADTTSCKVLSVAPSGLRPVVGKVTKRHNNYVIDDSIYFTQEMCNFHIRQNALVSCTVIESVQYIGSESLKYRAINVEKSKFLHYTGTDGEVAENGYIDEIGRMALNEYQTLMNDKFGVTISPKRLIFSAQIVNTSSKRTLTIQNSSESPFILKQINFNQDPSVCEFKIQPRGQQADADEELMIFAGEEVVLDVTCCPKMFGKTSEICVFDFGDFKIANILSVVGQSEDENFMLADKSAKDRPRFKKQAGDQDITRITTDLNRRRIRGCQSVRAPFFAQRRLPLNKIPNELFKILKEQDEKELRRRYPNALQTIKFENYKEKFQVSLWFEEIENDLRRRQYDLNEVRLTRHHGSPVTFTFLAHGIQDFQPPVNIQDTIDVFDEENPKNAKFQGTITKVNAEEVTCVFGDAFNNQYTGIPMTVQFNLSRTNYKRCHHAVQTAVDFLGKNFLFPEDDIVVKPPRILIYEDDAESVNSNTEVEMAKQQNTDSDAEINGNNYQARSSQSVFRRARPVTVFTEGQEEGRSVGSSNNEVAGIGRRVQSVRSRFVSDTASTPSCTEAKLQWFNKSLNEEQKNAVRRILRGQARPLPYIIYGPPGTGKTVTLVEAVMQVNKLDQNSRILVCAPSNAAADVIAEYLANSNQYHPGDFYRLNGYLRSGQSMLESIAPFCTDGEELTTVAMHRLIVATCMTAGQFFSLDLSVGHFTHVFVDEAGYCTEPETMVPSVLLALSKSGQLILAGDPNQLGPVLMSDVSQNCGLNKSFLERLMTRKLYNRNLEKFPTEKYNPLVLTKLVKNYRAHPTLLKLPSKLFYDDDLVSKASYKDAYELLENPTMKASVLKSEGVPLIFHGVQGHCSRERDSPSWCNKQEVLQVVQYVTLLLGRCGLKYDEIGIITPYRKQVEKIRLALQMTLGTDDLPKVASVEEFQGGERKVIIISTVRSVNEDKVKMTHEFLERLTFLYQPKRFNVVVTRAKALMIVVGNPHVLEKNNFWLQLLKYAIELNAYKGCNLPLHLDNFLRAQVHDRALGADVERSSDETESVNTALENGNGQYE